MWLEHLFYSTAIALLVGLVAVRLHRKDYSWIIILFAYTPDADVALSAGNAFLQFRDLMNYHPVLIDVRGMVD